MTPRRNILANFVGQAWVAVVGLAFIPVYLDRLGIEAYGLIGFYVVLQTWFSLLDLSISTTINREMARASAGAISADAVGNLLRSLEVIVLVLALAVLATLYFAAGPLAVSWLDPQTLSYETVIRALHCVAFVVAARFCEGLYRGALYGLDQQVFFSVAFAVLSTIRHAGAAAVVTLIPSIEAFFIWQAANSLFAVVVFASATHLARPKGEKPLRVSLTALYGITAFAGGLTLTSVFALAFTQMDKLLLSRLVDLDSFGQYMLAASLAGMFPTLAAPISAAFFPRLTAAVSIGDRDAEKRLFHSGAQLVALFVCPALGILLFTSTPLLNFWTGNKHLAVQVGSVLPLLAIGGFSNAVLQIPFMLQLAHGWTTLSVRINFLGALLLLPAVFFGASYYGIRGVAAAWAIVNLLVLSLAIVTMHRRLLQEELSRFLLDALLFPLFASLLTLGCFVTVFGGAGQRLGDLVLIFFASFVALISSAIATPIGRVMLGRLAMTLVTYVFRRNGDRD